MRVALIQMDIQRGKPEANRAKAAGLIREAAAGSDLVVLPEMWTTGYALADLAGNLADREGEPTGTLLSGLARECGVYIAGSAAQERSGQVYNTATVYGPDGQLLASYDKAHLVPMMDEHLYLTQGDRLALAELNGATAGLAICYDLRFPELFRTLALKGAQIMLVPAAWPLQRISHWQTLLVARAIENQCFVLGCNRVGSDGGTAYGGYSAIIDPWGNVLEEGGEAECILREELDLARVAEVRTRIPVFRDRRPELYR